MQKNCHLHQNKYSTLLVTALTLTVLVTLFQASLMQQICPPNQIGQTCQTYAPNITNQAVVANLSSNGNYSFFYYQPPSSQTFRVQIQICMQKIIDSNGTSINSVNGFNIIFVELQALNGSFYEYPVGGSGRTFPSEINQCEYLYTSYNQFRMKFNGQVQKLIIAIKYQSSTDEPVYEQILIMATGDQYYNYFGGFYIFYYIMFTITSCIFCVCMGALLMKIIRNRRGGGGGDGIQLNGNDPLIVVDGQNPANPAPFIGQPVQIGGENLNQPNNNLSNYEVAQQGYQAGSGQVQPAQNNANNQNPNVRQANVQNGQIENSLL